MISNTAAYEGGGAFISYSALNGIARNCLSAENSAGRGGGISLFDNRPTYTNTLENCTIVSNRTGGLYKTYDGTTFCFNVISQSNYSYNTAGYPLMRGLNPFQGYSCCVISNTSVVFMDSGNTTSSPAFADFQGRNYRLKRESPCINAGLNLPWMYSCTDLDGVSRIDKFSGRADMGCYEFHPQGIMFKVK